MTVDAKDAGISCGVKVTLLYLILTYCCLPGICVEDSNKFISVTSYLMMWFHKLRNTKSPTFDPSILDEVN